MYNESLADYYRYYSVGDLTEKVFKMAVDKGKQMSDMVWTRYCVYFHTDSKNDEDYLWIFNW